MFCIEVIYTARCSDDIEAFVNEVSREGIASAVRREAGCLRYEYFVPVTCQDGDDHSVGEGLSCAEYVAKADCAACGAADAGSADGSKLLLLEAWDSKEAQQVHLSQPHMKKLAEIKSKYIISTEIKTFTA